MSEQTIHAWGFVDRTPRSLQVSVVDGSVAKAASDLLDHIRNHERMEPADVTTTRTLDGWLVGVTFTVRTAPDYVMWHAIQTTSGPWIRQPATETPHAPAETEEP